MMLPDALGPYRIVRPIGKGGMGEVYLADDPRLGRRVAIKRLRQDHDCGRHRDQRRARLRREARAMARLAHPSIVPLFDLLSQDGEDWLVMEYVEGPCLADLLRDSKPSLEEALGWGRQIADGLAAAHEKGLIHRDLKTENVLIAGGRARILDFGLVCELPEDREGQEAAGSSPTLSQTGDVLGTLRTMAPEQVLGHEVGPRADLFSLGVLLYEMAAGRPPFAAPSRLGALHNLLERPARALPAEVPGTLAGLIEDLLQKAPELRPANARDVVRRLEAIRSELQPDGTKGDVDSEITERSSGTTAAMLVRRSGQVRRWTRPVAVIGFAAAALLLGVLGRISWQGERTPGRGSQGSLPVPSLTTALDVEEVARLEARAWAELERFDLPKQIDQAMELFQHAVEASPSSASAHAGLARANWRQFRATRDRMWLEQALAVARHAVQLDGEHLAAQVSLGLALVEAGEEEEVRATLGAVLERAPGHAAAHRGLGSLALDAGELDGAREHFLRALESRPVDRELLDYLTTVHFRQGDLEAAANAAQRSIELAPEGVRGLRNLAAILIARNDLEEASRVLDRALAIRPTATLYINQGTVFFFQGLYSQAATAWEKALEDAFGANLYLTWANLGDAYRQIPHRRAEAPELFRQAIRLLERELEEKPTSDVLRSRMALYLAKAGQADEARSQIEALSPIEDLRSMFIVTLALEVLGLRDEALELLRRVLADGFEVAEIEREPELESLRTDRRYHLLRTGGDR